MAKRVTKKNGNMPKPIPKGELLTDTANQVWKLGPSIGKGGFGEIYSAQEAKANTKKYNYVIKIEPHTNGPLFVEMHFYIKCAKSSDMEDFKRKHNLKHFGMPSYFGTGSHTVDGEKYRFIVMEKFADDINKKLQTVKAFSTAYTFALASQITYVLEYIHQCGYVHADIKGANILLGTNKHNAFLVDYGLATKLNTDKEFKSDPKKAHNGTIEFVSRDAHCGVMTRRGDFEILAYNIVQWLGGKLPWINNLKNTKLVQQKKEEAMNDVSQFLKQAFGNQEVNDGVIKLFKYLNTLEFDTEPDYEHLHDIFNSEIKKAGGAQDSLQLGTPVKTPTKRASSPKIESPKRMKRADSLQEEPKETKTGRKRNVNEDKTPVKSPKARQTKKKVDVVEPDSTTGAVPKKPLPKKKVSRKQKDVQDSQEIDEASMDESTEVPIEERQNPDATTEGNPKKALPKKKVARKQKEVHDTQETDDASIEESTEVPMEEQQYPDVTTGAIPKKALPKKKVSRKQTKVDTQQETDEESFEVPIKEQHSDPAQGGRVLRKRVISNYAESNSPPSEGPKKKNTRVRNGNNSKTLKVNKTEESDGEIFNDAMNEIVEKRKKTNGVEVNGVILTDAMKEIIQKKAGQRKKT